MPVWTLVANVGAVLADAVLGAVREVVGTVRENEDGAGALVVGGLMTGMAGSLSTVSTWVAEIDGMAAQSRYKYVAGSLTAAQAVGVAVYGTAVWVRR